MVPLTDSSFSPPMLPRFHTGAHNRTQPLRNSNAPARYHRATIGVARGIRLFLSASILCGPLRRRRLPRVAGSLFLVVVKVREGQVVRVVVEIPPAGALPGGICRRVDGHRHELRHHPQPPKLQLHNLAGHAMEEDVVGRQAVEEGVDPVLLQNRRQVGLELAQVVVVLAVRVKEDPVVLSHLWQDILPAAVQDAHALLFVPPLPQHFGVDVRVGLDDGVRPE
mmetsp:Transcript_35467/g.92145  ORF Transcript_35467/g.92145 Transcript_35467/m.92145 type:complete len:223 (-) Transcript_35467:31-699(-)